MKRYYLRLQVQSPVSISGHENRDGQTTPTLDYIPGSTLRGALAWHWLRRDAELAKDPTFKRLLDEGLLRCSALLPDRNMAHQRPAALGQVLPATARTCKVRPGFRTDPDMKGDTPHGVRDSLVALIEEEALTRWQKAGMASDEPEIKGLRAFEKCGRCSGAMDRFSGYFEWAAVGMAGHPNYWQPNSSKRMITRSAILPRLESTAPNNLYSREVLEEGQHLAGWLFVDEGMEAWMQSTLGEGSGGSILRTGETFSVGAARTAGLGQVRVVECVADSGDAGIWKDRYGAVDDRIANFTKQLPAQIQAQWSLVPITLLSDAILMDDHLRFASALTPDVLDTYLNLESLLSGTEPPPLPAGLELFVAAARTRRIAGWNTADGGKRPRSDDWAVAAGSVFVLAAAPDQQAELVQICRWLEENGVGERREDGFGQVIAAHLFHAVTEEV